MIFNFCFFFFPKPKICAQTCGRIKVESMAIVQNFISKSFCHTFPAIPKAQNYRECMETTKAIFRNSKEQIPSPVYLNCEIELISLVYQDESL